MNTYNFFQDRKIKTWERANFSIKANSYDEAVAKLEQFRDAEIMEDETAGIVISHNETLFDLIQITVAENEGFSTIELYNELGEEISNNAPNHSTTKH